MRRSIKDWQKEINAWAREKGWWPGEDYNPNSNNFLHTLVISSKLCLVHSEVSEALEALRDGMIRNVTISGKPEGLEVELADTVIRILDLAEWLGLDIEAAMQCKMDYNREREHRHGGRAI